MHLFFRYISFGILLLSFVEKVGACAIENGPPPLFTEYIKNTEATVGKIRNAISKSSCGNQGIVNGAMKTLEVLDRIDAQNPIFPDIITDFQYRIMLVVSGDARSPVMRAGELIRKLEERTILPALKQASSQCALDTPIEGGTPESLLTEILIENKYLESFFQRVAIGNPTFPEGTKLSKSLLEEIALHYSKDATVSCKHDVGLDRLSEKISNLLSSISGQAKKTNNKNDDWKIAIDLFRGTARNYNDIEKKLLKEELARQGMTKGAVESILTSLDCIQRNAGQRASLEDWGKARVSCLQPLILGGNEKVKEVFSQFDKPKTSDEYLQRRLHKSQSTYTASREITTFYRSIREKLISDNEERLNEKMLTDLIDMHIKLRETNELLEKRIPEMRANCQKGQPNIPCPK